MNLVHYPATFWESRVDPKEWKDNLVYANWNRSKSSFCTDAKTRNDISKVHGDQVQQSQWLAYLLRATSTFFQTPEFSCEHLALYPIKEAGTIHTVITKHTTICPSGLQLRYRNKWCDFHSEGACKWKSASGLSLPWDRVYGTSTQL